MDDLTRLDTVNRVDERRKQRAVVFNSVFQDMDDHNAESQHPQIVLVLETPIDGYENVIPALSVGDQRRVRDRPPFGLRDGEHFMVRESLPDPRIDALI